MTTPATLYSVRQQIRHQIKIKKSSFIGTLTGSDDRAAADAFVDEIRNEYPDATHNCFAWRIDNNLFRYYDDGEPSSTAGKPILSMIDKHQLVRCTLVVTRFYGGVKLGVGGLIQAYGQCAEETILAARLYPWVPKQQLLLCYNYAFTRQIEYLVEQYEAKILHADYESNVTARISIPEHNAEAFLQQIGTIGNGRITVTGKNSDEC